ncbi:MAG: hypothetical protein OSJ70_10450 [Bacilli bacterium]|nr:hypothetical protein [Bacilli bacterium]
MALEANEKEKKEDVKKTKTSGDVVKDIWDAFINTISGMYRRPITTIKSEVNNLNTRNNIIMLFLIALSFGLSMMTGFKSISSSIFYYGVSIDNFVDIPYLKILFYATFIYVLISFIPILVSFVIARVMKDEKFDFKKAICLYSSSMSILIPVNLLMAVLYGLNFLVWVGAIILSIVSVMSFFNYIMGYINLINVKEDKQVGTLTAFIVSWVVVAFIVFCLIVGATVSDLADGGLDKEPTKYTDIFDW